MSNYDFDASVALGATLLDNDRPDWWRDIDLHQLDQQDIFQCVLGQTYGHYRDGLDSLGVNENMMVKYGFGWSDPDGPHDEKRWWENLTNAWKWLIIKRRDDERVARLDERNARQGERPENSDERESQTEIIVRWVNEALRIGQAGTNGDFTAEGIAHYMMVELGLK